MSAYFDTESWRLLPSSLAISRISALHESANIS
nr:MAG TPA: hypothetical protein [Caudoviricetes sp.]